MDDSNTRPQAVDEELVEWALGATPLMPGQQPTVEQRRVAALIAEVRASRAREVELATERDMSLRMHQVQFERANRIEAQRDVLQQRMQQRIDKALASLPDASRYTVGAENALRVVFLLLDDIGTARAALTGDAS